MAAADAFTTAMAVKIACVTKATLDNWAQRGILEPSIETGPRPNPRLYTFRDLVAIRVLATLREKGIDLRGLKRVVEYVRKRKGLSAAEALASTVLITDGHDVYEQVDGTISVSALRKPGQVMFLVPLGPLVTEIQQNARAVLAGERAA